MMCWENSNATCQQRLSESRDLNTAREPQKSRSGASSSDRIGSFLTFLVPTTLLFAVLAITSGATGCAKKPVAIPDVSGQDPAQAQKTITAAGLKSGNMSGALSSAPGAYVASQSPVAGQQVAPNSTVDLVIDVPVTVPDLTGQNLTDAVSTLQGLDLKVAFVKKSSANPFGKTKVEQQSPTGNSPIHRNTTVTLTVSTPPDISALLNLVAQEPAYQNLKPEYKKVLDAFLGNPGTPRSMDEDTNASTAGSQPAK